MTERASSPRLGFNVIGHVYDSVGLGVAARGLIDSLVANGYPVRFAATGAAYAPSREFERFEPYRAHSLANLIHPVNLIVAGPSEVAALIREVPELRRPDAIKAAYIYWELDVVAEADRVALSGLDVIACASRFVADVFRKQCPSVRTVFSPQPFELAVNAVRARDRFGLANEAVIFCFSFNPNSDIERKNPYAVIRAFKRAFGHADRQQLIIKVDIDPELGNSRALNALNAEVAQHSNIRVISERMSYADVLALYASSDVYVSLHRSEGLGLGMLEAMLLGIPVLATGYSGNLSFMSDQSAALVPWSRIPCRPSHREYKWAAAEGATWADPDIDAAAGWMRRLAEDPELRHQLAERGRASAQAYVDAGRNAPLAAEIETMAAKRGRALQPASSLSPIVSYSASYQVQR